MRLIHDSNFSSCAKKKKTNFSFRFSEVFDGGGEEKGAKRFDLPLEGKIKKISKKTQEATAWKLKASLTGAECGGGVEKSQSDRVQQCLGRR